MTFFKLPLVVSKPIAQLTQSDTKVRLLHTEACSVLAQTSALHPRLRKEAKTQALSLGASPGRGVLCFSLCLAAPCPG